MNAQGMDPSHTSGNDSQTRRLEDDLAVRNYERRENSNRTHGMSKLRDMIRRILKRSQ